MAFNALPLGINYFLHGLGITLQAKPQTLCLLCHMYEHMS